GGICIVSAITVSFQKPMSNSATTHCPLQVFLYHVSATVCPPAFTRRIKKGRFTIWRNGLLPLPFTSYQNVTDIPGTRVAGGLTGSR
ncbi:MAG: hypothetical protein LBK66_10925, partial [Spirochaetaceae bacterium]|nr:hypothetical protein [Spirochaetaceae bacterium]